MPSQDHNETHIIVDLILLSPIVFMILNKLTTTTTSQCIKLSAYCSGTFIRVPWRRGRETSTTIVVGQVNIAENASQHEARNFP